MNAANEGLWAGAGVCGAIHRAAGSLLARCASIDRCPTGQTVITGLAVLSVFVLVFCSVS